MHGSPLLLNEALSPARAALLPSAPRDTPHTWSLMLEMPWRPPNPAVPTSNPCPHVPHPHLPSTLSSLFSLKQLEVWSEKLLAARY